MGDRMLPKESRRQFLASTAASAFGVGGFVIASWPAHAAAPIAESSLSDSDRVYPQGIASGDPRPDGMLLWTRIATNGPTSVRYQLAEDREFTRILRDGVATATMESDFTIRVRVEKLAPNRRYWYRFSANGVSSPVGRTRSAPEADTDAPVTVAFASCQDYQGRWYHAWRALADRADEIDVVLFLGDYVYEYERYPRLQEPLPGRAIKLPDGLVIDKKQGVIAARTLADYRELYRVTRSDKDLRRIHQLCPFLMVWDDHEHANDAWRDHAVDFNDRRGDEKDTSRREAVTRAWFEYLPVDVEYHPERGFPNDIVTWRKTRWGKHVELFLTDERYYRDDHLIAEGPTDKSVGKILPYSPLGSRTFCVKSVFEEREAKSKPTMLGAKQRDWLIESMKSSRATWKVWASALMVAPFVIDLRSFDKLPPHFRNVFYFKTDQWDGFLTERKQIFDGLASLQNLVVLSGDLHGFYAAELRRDLDDPTSAPMGVEFTVAGISSISLAEQIEAIVTSQPILAATGLGAFVSKLDDSLRQGSPHFVHADSRGYGVAIARFSEEKLVVEYLAVTDVRKLVWNGKVTSLRFQTASGAARIERLQS